MLSHEDVKSLKEKVLAEVRAVFSESAAPQYPFPVERAVDVLFKLLEHKLGDPELDAVGQQILGGISDGFERFDPVFATPRCEPFAKFLLKLVKPRRYEERCKELAEHKNEKGQPEPWKMTLSHAFKELDFGNGSVRNSQNPEKFRGQPRFAEHVCRVAMVRNHVHGARCYSLSEKVSIQQSIYVVLVFGAAEYLDEIESALLVARHRQFLEGLARPFTSWSQRFVSLEGREKAASAGAGLHPSTLADAWEWNTTKKQAAGDKDATATQQSQPARDPSLLKQIEAHSRLVLLGAPGAGKTTLLKYLAAKHAHALLNQSAQPVPFPIYIALQHCAPVLGKTIGSRIAAALGREPETQEGLFDRNVLLLLDGLNEVRENQKRLVVQEIKELLSNWQRLKVVVTSRPGAYRDEFGWPVIEGNAMTDSQFLEFLKGNLPDPTQAAGFAELLKHRNLHELGRNPLHLFMLIQTSVEHGGVLPENRGKLLQCFVRSLLQREEIQGAQQTNLVAKENLLAYFAFQTRGEGQVACEEYQAIQLLKQGSERLGSNVDIPRLLQELEDNNLFTRSGGDELSFTHEMYLDYFAAVEIGNRAQLEPFLVDNLQADPRWEEPLILYSGITGTRNQFISQISRLNPILAARSIASSAAPEVDLRRSINRIPEFGEVVSADSMHAHAELKDWDWLVEAIQRTEAFDDSQAEAMEKADSQVNALANIIAELDLPTAKRLVDALAAKEARQAIVMIGSWLCDEHGGTHTPQSFLCFKAGAMLGDQISMREYARCLLTGLGTDKNLFAGERWLRKAAVVITAGMRDLGDHLIKGDVLKRDAAEGERWLRKADGLGDLYASHQLGVFLLDGVLLPKNKTEGEKLLRAAAVGNAAFNIPSAMLELSDRLLNAGGGLKPNPAEGRLWLRKAVEAGHVPAIRTYALRLLVGDGLPQDLTQGQKLLREAAEAGDFWALWELGHRIVTGDGMARDVDEGWKCLSALAFTETGATMWSGQESGLQVPRNVKRGVEVLKCVTAAAEAGHPRAMCILGARLYEGRGLPKDHGRAEHWFRKAAEGGDEPAMLNLGVELLNGTYVSRNHEEGKEWLLKVAHADRELASSAISQLIERHASGRGLPKDPQQVIHDLELGLEKGLWFEGIVNWLFTGDGSPHLHEEGLKLLISAAEAGFQNAMLNLALRLLNGDGTKKDAPEGEKWLRKAAQVGHPEAMCKLAICLQDGAGMAKNQEEGELWVRRAANLDYLPAMTDLSCCLLDGIGMEKDLRDGEMWLRRAAEAGYEMAMNDLAWRLLDGKGLEKNATEGESWLVAAAEMGEPRAMYQLGFRKYSGNGVAKNPKEGERWIRMSAEKGFIPAMAYLGKLLLRRKRTKEGEQWLRKAAAGGSASAMFTLGTWLAQFPTSATEGEEWLRKAKEAGYNDGK